MPDDAPAISVVLNALGPFDVLEHTIARLLDQTIRGRIELVLVGPRQEEPWWTPKIREAFHDIRLVEIESFRSVGESNAAGARAATAEIVVFGEDHCFPEPGWAEALVERHQEDWAAVGPQIDNANPATAVGRSDFLIGYSPWAAPQRSGEVKLLPGHNSSYKKQILLEYGDALADWLQAETVLHYDLAAKGHKLFLEAEATAAHVNFSRASTWFAVQPRQGRVFAGERARGWGVGRRWFYAAASPLIPLVRLAKIAREHFGNPRSTWDFVRTLPCLAFGLVLDGAGQFVGYAFGPGGVMDELGSLELQRREYITSEDRTSLFPADPLVEKLAGEKL